SIASSLRAPGKARSHRRRNRLVEYPAPVPCSRGAARESGCVVFARAPDPNPGRTRPRTARVSYRDSDGMATRIREMPRARLCEPGSSAVRLPRQTIPSNTADDARTRPARAVRNVPGRAHRLGRAGTELAATSYDAAPSLTTID